VAIVHVRDGYGVSRTALIAEAGRHIARYKLPKQIVFVDEVVRSPSGKADYRWAAQLASSEY
jgi:3-oxocholest-4-en-26-oate---CoA ligase